MTNRDKILAVLGAAAGPLCDDHVTERANLVRRQVANAECKRLEAAGLITRYKGTCIDSDCHKLKWVNQRSDVETRTIAHVTSIAAHGPPTAAVPRPWYWEGRVQSALVSWLAAEGFEIRAVADTEARNRGHDIRAVTPDRGKELWITVKGWPQKHKHTQARHWFAGAVLDLVLYRDQDASVQLGLALPDGFTTYKSLVRRLGTFRRLMAFDVYWVSQSGEVLVEEGSKGGGG